MKRTIVVEPAAFSPLLEAYIATVLLEELDQTRKLQGILAVDPAKGILAAADTAAAAADTAAAGTVEVEEAE